MKGRFVGCSVLVALCASVCAAGTIYVDDDASVGGDGTSWETAFKLLLDGLAAAGEGDEIRVAQGTYTAAFDEGGSVTPLDRENTFQLINGVALLGGYRGCPDGDCLGGDPDERDIELYETILSGDYYADDGPDFENNDENCYHVVTGSGTDETALLDGVTITGGNANGSSWLEDCGAGMYNKDYTSPRLTNCTISGNSAGDDGGGMFNYGNSSPTLTDCTFSENSAGGGGGISNWWASSPTLTDCTFSGNSAYDDGGGMYSRGSCEPTLSNCTFGGNSAGDDGGGMHSREYNSPTLTDCTFSGNSAGGDGGGMYSREYNSLTLTDCTFSGNSAGGDGAGMRNYFNSSPTLTNCTFSGNSAYDDGGGMYSDGTSSPKLTNCTISGNSAGSSGGGVASGGSTTLTNCILWGDSPQEIFGSPVVTYCDVQGGWSGEGNIDSDPLFVGGPSGVWTADGAYDADACQITFTDGNAAWAEDELAGKFVNPDTSQPLQLVIVGNTATTMTIWADWNTIDAEASWVASGMSYQVYDYHLSAGSPCIDAGSNPAVPRDTLDLDEDGCFTDYLPDADGNLRFHNDPDTPDTGYGFGLLVDMGAYEFGSTPAEPGGPCPGDCNCDGLIDFFDIDPFVLAVTNPEEYVVQYPECEWLSADCNNDGFVDFFDIDPFVALAIGD